MQPRGFDVHCHFGQLKLHGLELGDRLAELLALLGVAGGVAPGALGRPSICAPMPMRPSLRVSMAIL